MPRPATLAAAAAESRLPRPPPSRRYLSSVLNGHDGSGSTDSNPVAVAVTSCCLAWRAPGVGRFACCRFAVTASNTVQTTDGRGRNAFPADDQADELLPIQYLHTPSSHTRLCARDCTSTHHPARCSTQPQHRRPLWGRCSHPAHPHDRTPFCCALCTSNPRASFAKAGSCHCRRAAAAGRLLVARH